MNISELVGKTLKSVEVNAERDRIVFTTTSGTEYFMYHSQGCCESVKVEDICGDLLDLVGASITQAEESSNSDWPVDTKEEKSDYDSYTWTFYRIATAKGLVVLRWYGVSNGYYSESVEFSAAAD